MADLFGTLTQTGSSSNMPPAPHSLSAGVSEGHLAAAGHVDDIYLFKPLPVNKSTKAQETPLMSQSTHRPLYLKRLPRGSTLQI